MISRGIREAEPPLLKLLVISGGLTPPKFLALALLSKLIDLASKVF